MSETVIKIPTRNIYEKKNPKVRDNVIERIEVVDAKEVVPNNEYDKPVYNFSISTKDEKFSKEWQEKFDFESAASSTQVVYAGVVAGLLPCYKKEIDIAIPKLVQNKLISQLKTGKDENKELNVKYSVEYKKYEGVATITGNGYSDKTSIDEIVSKNLLYPEQYTMAKGELPKKVEVSEESTGLTTNFLAEAKVELDDETNLGEEIIVKEDDDFWYAKVTVLCGIEIYFATTGLIKSKYSHTNPITMLGECEKYEPISVEITFYGNTIGIDLQDKTVYINGQTAKKVQSFDGNELMQTSNFIVDESGRSYNAIDKMYDETRKSYANGKETAVIRCSISDYFDEEGNKVIAVDNSTSKMSFSIGDKVIPMIYGADGNDSPMSLKQDKTPKVFQVVGVNKFYDGAVWQELSLQEC